MKGAKILLIDDDVDFVKAVKTILEKNSYECACAYSAKEGLEKVKEVKPDLILLDIMMGSITAGLGVVNELRNPDTSSPYFECSKIPILLITSIQKIMETNLKEIVGTQLLPVDGFLDKPVPNEVLLSKVKTLIGTI